VSNCLTILARKGEVTVLEHVGGKTIVAIQAYGGVLTLEGGTKDKLIEELCQMCKHWPDVPPPIRRARETKF
jgi:hypothetical protein